MKKLTDFERAHGYSPCPLMLGAPGCDVDLSLHAPGATCGGTWNECVEYKNANRFAGELVPNHPVGALLLDTIPHVEVTFEDDEEDEAAPDDASGGGVR
tara:strand:+ start:40689 stop:40985 length:297 start_codon:yes stop_codon:yes gene_type:complete